MGTKCLHKQGVCSHLQLKNGELLEWCLERMTDFSLETEGSGPFMVGNRNDADYAIGSTTAPTLLPSHANPALLMTYLT